jgi:hypothetical protein
MPFPSHAVRCVLLPLVPILVPWAALAQGVIRFPHRGFGPSDLLESGYEID